jgi:hypothetical protein
MKGWQIEENVRLPRGLGMFVYFGSITIDSRAVSVLYFDKSGGVILDIATKGLGYIHNPPAEYNQYAKLPLIAGRYCLLLAEFTEILWTLFREQGYTGRVSAILQLVTNDSQEGVSNANAHQGEIVFSITDPWLEHAQKIATMVNEMTRSWLNYAFGLQSWEQGSIPEFKGI